MVLRAMDSGKLSLRLWPCAAVYSLLCRARIPIVPVTIPQPCLKPVQVAFVSYGSCRAGDAAAGPVAGDGHGVRRPGAVHGPPPTASGGRCPRRARWRSRSPGKRSISQRWNDHFTPVLLQAGRTGFITAAFDCSLQRPAQCCSGRLPLPLQT